MRFLVHAEFQAGSAVVQITLEGSNVRRLVAPGSPVSRNSTRWRWASERS